MADDATMTFADGLAQFAPVELPSRVLLNSVPKCGTMMLRNIALSFAGPAVHHYPFLVDHNLASHAPGLDNPAKKLFVGHVNWGHRTRGLVRDWRQVLLVRDPYDYALSQARFVHSDGFSGPFHDYVIENKVSFEDTLRFVIFGMNAPGVSFPSLAHNYTFNAVAWLGQATLVNYETLIDAIAGLGIRPSADATILRLLSAMGIDNPPADWRERVKFGAERRWSATDRGNLTNGLDESDIPKTLPREFRAMIDTVAPSLRATLGYS